MMSSGEISKPAAELAEVYVCNIGVSNVTTEPFTHQGGIKRLMPRTLVCYKKVWMIHYHLLNLQKAQKHTSY